LFFKENRDSFVIVHSEYPTGDLYYQLFSLQTNNLIQPILPAPTTTPMTITTTPTLKNDTTSFETDDFMKTNVNNNLRPYKRVTFTGLFNCTFISLN
jgi:hypothetical protein